MCFYIFDKVCLMFNSMDFFSLSNEPCSLLSGHQMGAKHKHNLSSSDYRKIRINEIYLEEVKMECFAFEDREHFM